MPPPYSNAGKKLNTGFRSAESIQYLSIKCKKFKNLVQRVGYDKQQLLGKLDISKLDVIFFTHII